MTNEERNRVMDGYFKERSTPISWNWVDLQEAIRECDRKARAWDALEKIGTVEDIRPWNLTCWQNLGELMAELLTPPQPKDPLEELEKFVTGDWVDALHSKGAPEWIRISTLLAEIRRLRGKK